MDLNESSFSLTDLNVSVHQDITLTPPSDNDLLDFFIQLKGTHKQVEKCADLKLDYRYLIQRFINLGTKDLVSDTDKPRLKSLVQKLVSHIGLGLHVKKK